MTPEYKIEHLETIIQEMYKKTNINLPFHNLKHLYFIQKKALRFAEHIGADLFLTKSAAIVHDLNYLLKHDQENKTEEQNFLKRTLYDAGYTETEMSVIEHILSEVEAYPRPEHPSKESQAIADADMLFRALPITPLYYTRHYMEEKGMDLKSVAHLVVTMQKPLLDKGIFFYTDIAKDKYLTWAQNSIALFTNLEQALQDNDIVDLIE